METTHLTYGEAWIENLKLILRDGKAYYDESEKIYEIINLSNIITKPNLNDSIINNLADEKQLNRMFRKFSEIKLQPNAYFSYAQRLLDYNSINQVKWLIDRLKGKQETKSATITTLIPGDCSKHLPCFTTLDVKIRENQLFATIFFRSQNIGTRQPCNFLAIHKVLECISKELNVVMGEVYFHIASAHIYDFDIEYCKNLLKNI